MTKLIDLKGRLKVGQKVKEVRKKGESVCALLQDGKEAEITEMDAFEVWFDNCPHPWTSDIELDVSLTPTWETLGKGDEVEDEDGNRRKVLERLGDLVFLSYPSYMSNWEATSGRNFHIESLKRMGYKIITPPEEVVEVLGKRYKREAVEEKLKELPEINN